MDLKLILKTFSNLRRMTSDEVAFLETLRAMNESECEALVETLAPQPVRKSSTKKSASKKSSRASSLEQQIQKRGRQVQELCVAKIPHQNGTCDMAENNPIHDESFGYGNWHPFSPAAPTASDSSSANGGAGSGTASSETQKASAGSAVHEQSSNV